MDAGIPVGGYCPKGRLAEDGIIPARYPMMELESPVYRGRTERNVVESDGTLILNKGGLSEGTGVTSDFAVQHGKPCLVVQLDAAEMIAPEQVIRWFGEQRIGILNIAGPRESKYPQGIYGEARAYLERLFSKLKEIA